MRFRLWRGGRGTDKMMGSRGIMSRLRTRYSNEVENGRIDIGMVRDDRVLDCFFYRTKSGVGISI